MAEFFENKFLLYIIKYLNTLTLFWIFNKINDVVL